MVVVRGAKSMPAARDEKAEDAMMMEQESAPLPVTVSESTISFSFDVNVPQTILSDGKPEVVELQRLTVPATYSYAATPKLQRLSLPYGLHYRMESSITFCPANQIFISATPLPAKAISTLQS